jgi:hypothetical protein
VATLRRERERLRTRPSLGLIAEGIRALTPCAKGESAIPACHLRASHSRVAKSNGYYWAG